MVNITAVTIISGYSNSCQLNDMLLTRGFAFLRRYIQIILLFIFFATSYLFSLVWIPKRPQTAVKIAVVTIVKDVSDIDEYRLAMETFECYCIHHRYTWVVIDVARNDTLKLLCPQDQFFFQRHCITAQFLQENNYDYVLFVDSDMGVINPKRRIEEYIMRNKDIIFYNRIWNIEVMAGSFLAKNTRFANSFLRMWANYNYLTPRSFHGSDNAAIHTVLLHIASESVKHCEPLWNKSRLLAKGEGVAEEKGRGISRSYTDVFTYEACVRAQLEANDRWKDKIAVLPKGQSWARDGWLTDSKWSEKDFIFHGWQKRRLNAQIFASWKLPLLSTEFNMSLCGTDAYMQNWKYNMSFAKDPDEIQIELNTVIALKENEYHEQKRLAEKMLDNFRRKEMTWNNASCCSINNDRKEEN